MPSGFAPASNSPNSLIVIMVLDPVTKDNISVTMFAQKDFICDG